MLKPDPNDPNYSDQMRKYKDDPSGWGPPGAAMPSIPEKDLPKEDRKK